MAAPTYVGAGTGLVHTGTTAANATKTGVTVGNIVIAQVLVDGTNDTSPYVNDAGVETLDGSGAGWDLITDAPVGASDEGRMWLYIARATDTTVTFQVQGSFVGGNDLYARVYEFSDVNTGSQSTDVLEQLGFVDGTSTSVALISVDTQGADRLVVQFGAINDDNQAQITDFTGESGGTYAAPETFGSSTGTDGALFFTHLTKATAGSVTGGSETITSDAWGVIGFALIPAASFATHEISAAENFGPAIVTALDRETFLSIPDDLGLSIVTALLRETFISADMDLGLTIVSALESAPPVVEHFISADFPLDLVIDTALLRETFVSADFPLGMVIDSALLRETFLTADMPLGPVIDSALLRETFLSAAETYGVDIVTNLIIETGGVEHFISAAFDLGYDAQVSLVRETFLAAEMPLGIVIDTSLIRETFLSATTDLDLQIATNLLRELLLSVSADFGPTVATALLRETFMSVPYDLGLQITSNLVIEGQPTGGTAIYRTLLGAG